MVRHIEDAEAGWLPAQQPCATTRARKSREGIDVLDYQRLIAEHDHIDALCAELEALASAEPPHADDVATALDELARAVREHLRQEDSFVYPALLGHPDAEEAQALATEFETLKSDWAYYLADWSIECIRADWRHFRTETVAMLSRLRNRTRRESEILYGAALRKGLIALRSR